MDNALLTRDEFRSAVFDRDGHRCIICKSPAADAHHIVERRLFIDGGYYLENGASLCGKCHLLAEQTAITCEDIRLAAGITHVILPSQFYPDEMIDKWGNQVLPNGLRMRGELFDDENVQKVLASGNVLGQFTKYVKHPRTVHLPWSEGISNDDRVIESLEQFIGKEVVVTIKYDGENTSLYNDYIHARSVDSRNHPSRNWVKNMHAKVGYLIPEGWRVVGENLWAVHSIKYSKLPNLFIGFSVWDDRNLCFSWAETITWLEMLELTPPKVLYHGIWNDDKIRSLYSASIDGDECEGYVVRIADDIPYANWGDCVAKYVRKAHVRTHGHWTEQVIQTNRMVSLEN
jgi:hypothetical protein